MNKSKGLLIFCALTFCVFCSAIAQDTSAGKVDIIIKADQPMHRISRLLTGACIEDVNHEIYGGLYSQMIFGESFQELPPPVAPKGFCAYDGVWEIKDGILFGGAGAGPKLIYDLISMDNGEVAVDILFKDKVSGNAGLIVRVENAGVGADNFDGYEISIDASGEFVRLGRHRHSWEHIRDVPTTIPTGEWITLSCRLNGRTIEVLVNKKPVIKYEDDSRALIKGKVGLRQWQRSAEYRNLRIISDGVEHRIAFERQPGEENDLSGMWRVVKRGDVSGKCELVKENVFVGKQSQRITYISGNGEYGIENRGLNRWGMYFVKGKSYEGIIWARAEKPTKLTVALESAYGSSIHAEKKLRVKDSNWQKLKFTLTPVNTETNGRFTIKLTEPGDVVLGYAFLQPGEWGRFKGLPVRRDIAEALIDQGITVLRYGGSMINHPEYRWKKMIGDRDRRPPYRGFWYPHSSNGWGIPDFMNFCEAAGFEYIPVFNIDETPQDMVDFIEYAKGKTASQWGRKRADDGHPRPYRLRFIELGNEERIDDVYAEKFERLASAIWSKDPEIILIVGDFVYTQPIEDPFNFHGAASGITSLSAHQRILKFAKERGQEVWFDVHVGTDGPIPDNTFYGMLSYKEALEKIADGAKFKVVVFEFNAGNHSHRRALANAIAINTIERDGCIPIACSANCLQPDGQNDNGWDQGLLFLNQSKVWLQPPGWVTRMISKNYLPLHIPSFVLGKSRLDVSAKRSEDGKTIVVNVVNPAAEAIVGNLKFEGVSFKKNVVMVEELSGELNDRNTADNPHKIIPKKYLIIRRICDGEFSKKFPPFSFTILRFEN